MAVLDVPMLTVRSVRVADTVSELSPSLDCFMAIIGQPTASRYMRQSEMSSRSASDICARLSCFFHFRITYTPTRHQKQHDDHP
jgi:hypothetical protein